MFHRIVKRQAMVYFFILLFLLFQMEIFGNELVGESVKVPSTSSSLAKRSNDVFRVQNVTGNYLNSLNKLLAVSESRGGLILNPEIIPSIGIKIKTQMAPGLQVSPNLLNALLEILSARGYQSNQIFIADRDLNTLIEAGFHLPGSGVSKYKNCNLFSSRDSQYYHDDWFHDSPMPPTLHDRTRFFIDFPQDRNRRLQEERKSYLPVLFFLKNVFWINLAVASDHMNLGINGASANMSTGAISNYQRFLDRATIAPAAVTEILAIPEIWEKRTYSILDLSKFQFANGGQFDAEFIGRESTLLLSENPLSIDRFALSVINQRRIKKGFVEREEEKLPLFKYGMEIGLGDARKARIFNVQ